MTREHRVLNGQTGELTITPFTVEEEAAADQREIDVANAANTPEARTEKARVEYPGYHELVEAMVEGEQGKPAKMAIFMAAVQAARIKHGV